MRLVDADALAARMKALKHQIASQAAGFVDEDSYECGAVDGLHDALTYTMEAPSVPAVPLDKLCEFLYQYDMPCEMCEDYLGCSEDQPCGGGDDGWKIVLAKWMEGLDAAESNRP